MGVVLVGVVVVEVDAYYTLGSSMVVGMTYMEHGVGVGGMEVVVGVGGMELNVGGMDFVAGDEVYV